VPYATRLDVQTIATAAASICRTPTVVSKITKHRQKQAAEKMAVRLQMEEKEAQDRTPDQWRKMIADKKSELEEKVGKLMEQIITLCLDRHRTRVGQILKEWAPKWAAVGVDLSCLDITRLYLQGSTSEKYKSRNALSCLC